MYTALWPQGLPELNIAAGHVDEAREALSWNWDPGIMIGIGALAGLYLYGIGIWGRRPASVAVGYARIASFLSGCLLMLLALVSPLDPIADDYLFSAHMAQHMLLAIPVPLLWLLGTPGWLIDQLLQPKTVHALARALANPAAAFLLFNVNFLLWHVPALYELALDYPWVHIIQHLSFLATGVLNWWPVVSPTRDLPRLDFPKQIFYLALDCQPGVILGAVLVFSSTILYPTYLAAPRLFDISALTDQQLGGLIMWIPGNAFYLIALSIVFLQWMQNGETAEGES